MNLTATIEKDEIVRLVRGATPLRLDFGPRRSVSFGAPVIVDLVAGSGLRVRGDAKMTWEIAGLPLPIALRAWQILLVPSVIVRDAALVLAFDPVLEDLDFKRVPGFFDERIVELINDGVASQRRKLAWNVSRSLTWRTPLPARISPAGGFELFPIAATVAVTAAEVRADVSFEARVTRREARAPAPVHSA